MLTEVFRFYQSFFSGKSIIRQWAPEGHHLYLQFHFNHMKNIAAMATPCPTNSRHTSCTSTLQGHLVSQLSFEFHQNWESNSTHKDFARKCGCPIKGYHVHQVSYAYVPCERPPFSALNFCSGAYYFHKWQKYPLRSISILHFCRSEDHHIQNFFTFKPFIAIHGRLTAASPGLTAGQSDISQMRPTVSSRDPHFHARARSRTPIFHFAIPTKTWGECPPPPPRRFLYTIKNKNKHLLHQCRVYMGVWTI